MLYSANIMYAMQQIHMLGIAPKDFAEGNVLVNESGQYMIIDFENCQRGHKCQWSYDFSARSDSPRRDESKRLAIECSSPGRTQRSQDSGSVVRYTQASYGLDSHNLVPRT